MLLFELESWEEELWELEEEWAEVERSDKDEGEGRDKEIYVGYSRKLACMERDLLHWEELIQAIDRAGKMGISIREEANNGVSKVCQN
ncbi:unnamed protein product [Blepharisma stoltei]|uniref:Uncharacterized protein n=1 Tax=Blepharisma stoltei TaxID=1481888 RepID=A0AAU9IC21_9CILI|nr:unnamed protein product [Blepharisma stoltei]